MDSRVVGHNSALVLLSVLKAWVSLGQLGSVRATYIIVTCTVFIVRMSCDASVT